MQILSIKMEVCIQILKANIYMQESNWTKDEKNEFWQVMEFEAIKLKQVILPNKILMEDVKGYPKIQSENIIQ